MNTVLIIACVALSLVIACTAISIVAIYYSQNPKASTSNSTFGDISVGSVTASGAVTTNNLTSTGNISVENGTTGLLTTSGTVSSNVFAPANTVDLTGVINVTGTTNATSSSTGTVQSLGGLAVGGNFYTNGSLYLPTTGGTAFPLNNYSEYILNATATGPYASGQLITFRIVRAGSKVTMSWTPIVALAATFNAAMTITPSLPTGFGTNSDQLEIPIYVQNNVVQLGVLQINSNAITIFGDQSKGNFLSVNQTGVLSGSASWNVI